MIGQRHGSMSKQSWNVGDRLTASSPGQSSSHYVMTKVMASQDVCYGFNSEKSDTISCDSEQHALSEQSFSIPDPGVYTQVRVQTHTPSPAGQTHPTTH